MKTYSEVLRKIRLAQNHLDMAWKSSLDLGDAEDMLEHILDDIMDVVDVLADMEDEDE